MRVLLGPGSGGPAIPRLAGPPGVVALVLALAAHTGAQFDPTRAVREAPPVAARFADPAPPPTPAFADGRTDLTSHDEALAFLERLAAGTPGHVTVETAGRSQEGRALALVALTGTGGYSAARPTVLVLAQQHGNEPSGGEAALALAARLAGPDRALLDRVNVYVVPRANPDGAEHFVRATASGADVNRDHLLLQTPEAQAIAAVTRRLRPDVVLDLHEFTVADRWVKKYGVVQYYDALLQGATVGNLSPAIAREADTGFLAPVRAALTGAGLHVFQYHTTSTDPDDKVVSAGGVQPDTGRNVNGLRQAVSILIETRGVGLGRAHLARRVQTHVTAAMTVVAQAARRGPRLLATTRQADAEIAGLACTGRLVVAAGHTPGRLPMTFLDAASGAERRLVVPWRSADTLEVVRARPRPCGYLLAPGETAAVEKLRLLGVQVDAVTGEGRWHVERYHVVRASTGAREDARGAIDGGAPIAVLDVALAPSDTPVAPGAWFVDMAQPLASLAAAALEPDSQNSFAASGLVDVAGGGVRRVTAPAPPGALGDAPR
ncbi:MAG: M14 family zinc carboxypeptidase [Vicinamibacterales bacterium]